jgi:hypothetical protein
MINRLTRWDRTNNGVQTTGNSDNISGVAEIGHDRLEACPYASAAGTEGLFRQRYGRRGE